MRLFVGIGLAFIATFGATLFMFMPEGGMGKLLGGSEAEAEQLLQPVSTLAVCSGDLLLDQTNAFCTSAGIPNLVSNYALGDLTKKLDAIDGDRPVGVLAFCEPQQSVPDLMFCFPVSDLDHFSAATRKMGINVVETDWGWTVEVGGGNNYFLVQSEDYVCLAKTPGLLDNVPANLQQQFTSILDGLAVEETTVETVQQIASSDKQKQSPVHWLPVS